MPVVVVNPRSLCAPWGHLWLVRTQTGPARSLKKSHSRSLRRCAVVRLEGGTGVSIQRRPSVALGMHADGSLL